MGLVLQGGGSFLSVVFVSCVGRWCRVVSGCEVVGERGGGETWGGFGWEVSWDFRMELKLGGVFCVGLQVSGDDVEGEV